MDTVIYNYNYCRMPNVSAKEFNTHMNPLRFSLISYFNKIWTNGTVLHYYFYDKDSDGRNIITNNGTKWVTWTTNEEEKNIVREAFAKWKDIGIGLNFKEVETREDAEIRIGFMNDDGAWSYIGTDIVNPAVMPGKDDRTMNFGWSLLNKEGIDTAMHEIGHTLGFSHEHQNPNSGIKWDKEAVYNALAQAPNYWPKDMVDHNILNKLPKDELRGSDWDPNSIMHYPFGPGLIISPHKYQKGLVPEPGLSKHDIEWVKKLYPPITDNDLELLLPSVTSKLELNNGEQKSYIIKPAETKKYNISTFGTSDGVIVLYEKNNNDPIYITADNDNGEDYNANLNVKLYKNKEYLLRVRISYSKSPHETSIMYW